MNIFYKIASIALPMIAGTVAKKVSDGTWKLTTGRTANDPVDPEVGIKEAALFALVSGAAMGIARMVADRQTSQMYMKSEGKLPPELDKKLGLTEEQSRAKALSLLEMKQAKRAAKKA